MIKDQNEILVNVPEIGFIAYSNTEFKYVAAGFLRMVEGGYAQIDTLVTNPSLDPEVRSKGIDLVVEKLINTAKDMKLEGIYALTLHKNIISRAEAIGFRITDYKVVALKF